MSGVRKGLLIGAIALVGIGVGTYLFSQPRNGTVEYHKRKYLQTGVPRWALAKGVPSIVRGFYERRFSREVEFHRSALIDAGYLAESVFVISNCSVEKAVPAFHQSDLPKEAREFLCTIWWTPAPIMITVIAPRESMKEIAEAIRKSHVPESAK